MKERRAPAWPGPEKARTDSAGAQPDVRGMNESNCNARRGFNAKQCLIHSIYVVPPKCILLLFYIHLYTLRIGPGPTVDTLDAPINDFRRF